MSKRKRIAISGMGRIGRSILKINLLNNDFDVAFCNDINPDIKNLVYLLNYDSTYGSSENRFSFIEQKISYNNHNFNYLYKIHSWKSSGISMMSIFLYYHQD